MHRAPDEFLTRVRVSPRRGKTPVAVLAFAALLAAGCRPPPPALEPVAADESRDLDPEVLALVETHMGRVRERPTDARAHGSLGLVYEANGIFDAAERSFENAALIDPDEPLWRFHRAITLAEVGRTSEAIALMRTAAAELAEAVGVQHRLGQVLLDTGDVPGAHAAFERALALAPEQPECLVGLAGAKLAREEWEPAMNLALRGVRGAPDYKQAHYVLGLAYRGLGRMNEAARALAQGVDAKARFLGDPLASELDGYAVNYVSQRMAANSLAARGQHAAAAALWERVLAKRPDDHSAWTNYAAALVSQNRLDDAFVALDRSLALAPNEFATYINLADACRLAHKLDDAQQAADRAVELAPEVGPAHMARARVLVAREDFRAARAELEQAARIDTRDPIVRVALGEVCTRLDRGLEALGWFREALELDPSHLPARVNLANLTYRSGDVAGARAQVKELLRIAPDNERVQAMAKSLGLLAGR